ncbi:hypothetical protein [Pseudomonas sp. A-RE-19]|uniref:hypothetical protein n=1 Tax=Pseudomonas sp. A-RE-19 TaxID=2832401 RepID=UPI001CBDC7AF|nr:hypothetical protein [Pseudomonas sp. A-RE-19]
MRLALLANTARALHQPSYIEGIGNPSLTANPAKGSAGESSIIEKHKYDEATYPATHNLQPLNTQTFETKKAPDC